MKKAILLSLVLALFLSGCGSKSADVEGESEPIPTLEEVAHGAAEGQAEVYRARIAALEAELLSLKSELWGVRADYEERIAALQAALDASASADESSFLYTVTDGKATVTGYTGKGGAVVLPTTLGGVPVTAIADRAFENNRSLTAVTVGEGVRSIGWFAFSGCVALSRVALPKSLERIEYGAFENCPSELTVVCPDDSYARRYAESYGFATREK